MVLFKEWHNTMTAGRITILLAKIFGRKTVARDMNFTVTIHHFMGKSYITNAVKDGNHG